MNDLSRAYNQYITVATGDLSGNQKKEIYQVLSRVKPEDLITLGDHKCFLELLHKFRMASIEDVDLFGKNFRKTLESLLSVGEDGVYSNSLRFIYELIQNVDDCDYSDVDNCMLDVKFDYTNNGTIIFSYNEKGFTPTNVFAITGIAEQAKNISAEKVEIGEKGIGFKSVFGIADSVLIQSGKFSFELYKNNFTVPIPRYDSYVEVTGTRLTLRMNASTVHEIYREIVKQYGQKAVLLNKNPILFLNKLTSVRFYVDNSSRYLKFNVSRSIKQQAGCVQFESNVKISVDIKDRSNGLSSTIQNEICCYRYTMPIVYDRTACVSRYSESTTFTQRRHNLVAIVPFVAELKGSEKEGSLYSFLPTQIKTRVPMVIHVPYKLDGSREYVDPQGKNAWFNFTNDMLSNFIKHVYNDLATRVKEDIVEYLLKSNDYFFVFDNEKINCLKLDCFRGTLLRDEKLFYTVNNVFEPASKIIAFDCNEGIQEAENVYLMLGLEKSLFVPKNKINMSLFGVETIKDAYSKLFVKAFKTPEITNEALAHLLSLEDFDFSKEIARQEKFSLTSEQINAISKFKKVYIEFQKFIIEQIKLGKKPRVIITDNVDNLDDKNYSIISETIEAVDLDDKLSLYLKFINEQYCVMSGVDGSFFLTCENMLVLSSEEPLNSFAQFTEKFDSKGTFSATLKMRQASEKLNSACDDMNNNDYLKLLQAVRKSLVDAFGKDVYNNYIQIINKSGVDESRFVNELLQNADDCSYTKVKEPSFSFNFNGKELITYYNEDGFSKANVRSITSIGESTKKLLLSGENDLIGEKGIGFKSVFSVAQSVSINSNGFNFKLTADRPTIPVRAEKASNLEGTQMVFDLKKVLPDTLFTKDEALSLSICLRKLRKIRLGKFNIHIVDTDVKRKIIINDKEYSFKKFIYPFTVEDAEAISGRENQQRKINKEQKMCFYIPEHKLENYRLYSGLPTAIELNIPMIVDAPFEVTTSREGVLQSRWNDIIRKEFYYGLIKLIHAVKEEEKLDVLRYIMSNNVFFSSIYLNQHKIHDMLVREKIIPLWGSETFVSPNECECKVYPDVCYYLFEHGVSVPEAEYIVNCYKKQSYGSVLIWLGCKTAHNREVLAILSNAVDIYISDESFRELLYSYLHENSGFLRGMLNKIRIIPVKPLNGDQISFVSRENKIFIASELNSTEEYYLLNETILPADEYYEIFGEAIPKMDVYQRQGMYRERVLKWLEFTDKSKAAELLLNEFNTNKSMLDTCRYDLIGRIADVPLKFICGEFLTGNKYIDKNRVYFLGEIIPHLVVHPQYEDLAIYLGCKSIYDIHYSDIDYEIEKMSADDIEDIWNQDLLHRSEIIKGYILDGKIPSELIELYQLEGILTPESMYKEENYDFPTKRIIDLQRIKNHIAQLWHKPNKIINRTVERQERVSTYPYDKNEYVLSMYSCSGDDSAYFCQICKKPLPIRYIEVNAIEYEPEFAWAQMHLCLCVKCSKDYILLRNNKNLRKEFISELITVEFADSEPIPVSIGNTEVNFTATHLAEIQEILKLQNQNNEL